LITHDEIQSNERTLLDKPNRSEVDKRPRVSALLARRLNIYNHKGVLTRGFSWRVGSATAPGRTAR
jgi:hypothetical protein